MDLVMVNKPRMRTSNKAWKNHKGEQLGRMKIANILGRFRRKISIAIGSDRLLAREKLPILERWKTITIPMVLMSSVKMRNQYVCAESTWCHWRSMEADSVKFVKMRNQHGC